MSTEVVKDLKERDTHVKKQDREVTKRSLESEQSDDPAYKYKFEKKARMSKDDPFKIVTEDKRRGGHTMSQRFRVDCTDHELLPQQGGSQGRPHMTPECVENCNCCPTVCRHGLPENQGQSKMFLAEPVSIT